MTDAERVLAALPEISQALQGVEELFLDVKPSDFDPRRFPSL